MLGLAIDERRNDSARHDAEVAPEGSTVRVLVITSREDLEIAGLTRQTLNSRN